jgi:GNAT superfamily N-acetyltransferase
MQERYYKIFQLDRSVDQSRLANYIATADDSFPSDIFPEMWYLAGLAVDPAYQRRGAGTMLTRWGIDQARTESVPAGLEASLKGSVMYERLGFRVLNQLEWMEGRWSSVMVWDASGEDGEGSWFKRVKEAVETRKR